MIRQVHRAETSVVQGRAVFLDLREIGDMLRKVCPLGLLKARAERWITVFLSTLCPPLGTVVHARKSRHTESQRINQRQMRGVIEVRCDPRHVVVIHKTHEMKTSKPAPVLRPELLDQGVDDLEHIHAVKAAEESLIAGIVRAGMAHLSIDPHLIVAVQKLAQKQELRLQSGSKAAKFLQEFPVEAVCHVKAQSVDIEILDPVADLIEDVIYHGIVPEIELHQIEAAFPAFVPEAVVIVRVAVKRDMEPVLIRRIPLLFLHIVKSPEASSDVVENTVEYHTDTCFVKCPDDFLKIFIRAEAAVDQAVVSGVIAMCVRLEHRREINGVDAQFLIMRDPVDDLTDRRRR